MNVLPASDPLQSVKLLTDLIETYDEQHATRGQQVSFTTVNFTTSTKSRGNFWFTIDTWVIYCRVLKVCVEDVPNTYHVLAILTSVAQIIPYWSTITLSVMVYSDHDEFQQNAQQVAGNLVYTDETKIG